MRPPRFDRTAYTLDAVIAAGIPPNIARTLLAAGRHAVAERPRTSLTGRGREKQPTTHYVWGPDAQILLDSLTDYQEQTR